MKIIIKTSQRTTVYNHDFYLSKHDKGIIEIMRVSDRKIVERIKPYYTIISKGIYEICGEEVVSCGKI